MQLTPVAPETKAQGVQLFRGAVEAMAFMGIKKHFYYTAVDTQTVVKGWLISRPSNIPESQLPPKIRRKLYSSPPPAAGAKAPASKKPAAAPRRGERSSQRAEASKASGTPLTAAAPLNEKAGQAAPAVPPRGGIRKFTAATPIHSLRGYCLRKYIARYGHYTGIITSVHPKTDSVSVLFDDGERRMLSRREAITLVNRYCATETTPASPETVSDFMSNTRGKRGLDGEESAPAVASKRLKQRAEASTAVEGDQDFEDTDMPSFEECVSPIPASAAGKADMRTYKKRAESAEAQLHTVKQRLKVAHEHIDYLERKYSTANELVNLLQKTFTLRSVDK